LGRNGVSKGDTSSFYAIYKSLKETEKIRILIGIGTTRETYDLLESTLNKERGKGGGIPKQTTKKL